MSDSRQGDSQPGEVRDRRTTGEGQRRMDSHGLTARQLLIVRLVSQGLTDAQVAENLLISRTTVRADLHTVMTKWNCRNRTQVAVEAARRDL